MQLLGGAQGFHGGIAPGQVAVAQEAMDAAVAGLTQIHGLDVAAAFFAGHEVVAARVLHGARAKSAVGGGWALGAGGGFGGGLGKLLAAGHGDGGQIGLTGPVFYPVGRKKLCSALMSAYIDLNLIA